MFGFIKKLFGKKDKCCCEHCNCNSVEDLPFVYSRKGYEIIVPQDIAAKFKEEALTVSATKYNNKPSCVQIFKTVEGKSKYVGTLKDYMNVESFKDGNVCNFNRNNLIYRKEK